MVEKNTGNSYTHTYTMTGRSARSTRVICLLLFGVCLLATHQVQAQEHMLRRDSIPILMSDMYIQIECTQAVNDMYNFKFREAEKQFRWLKYKYPWHPLPYFLLGLNEWWKIAPNIDLEKFDDKFYAYMDSSIFFAERLYKKDKNNMEAAFFLSAGYAFKSRLHSERSNWTRAATNGRLALKYLDVSRGQHDLSPEFLFGDALYNYYSIWIPENYPALKPILAFFPKGDKALGLQQLKETANNAFYTRVEAQYFLMRILSLDENQPYAALQISEYLAKNFPDNAYFQRYYARMLYSLGKFRDCEQVSLNILEKIDKKMPGYEANSGRYACFFLGQIYTAYREAELAKTYYSKGINFGEELEAYETGYFLYSLLGIAKLYDQENNTPMAKMYFEQIRKYAKRKHPAHEQAREYLKNNKKVKAAKK